MDKSHSPTSGRKLIKSNNITMKRVRKGKNCFFSMEIKPKGMSVGNFVDNVKRTVGSVKSALKARPKRKK